MHISGDNFQNGILRGDKKSSYYFSKYTHSWGWATWKRAWELFSPAIQDFKSFDENNLIKNVSIKNDARKFWIKNFRQTIKGKDSWDSLWMYAVWYNNGLAVLPQNNLISNIGFGEDATHTKETGLSANMSTLQIDEMVYTKDVLQDKDADNYTFKTLFRKSILSKILIRIKKNLS